MISIVIPTYNSEKTILNTLDSIDKQDVRDFEVIIVDDGSTDATCDLINSSSSMRKFSTLLFKEENRGPGSARNIGISLASGDYIVFVDSDDLLAENYLSTLLSGFGDGIDFCFSQYYRITDSNPNSKTLIKSELSGINDSETVFSSFICNRTHISLWNSMFKLKLINDNNIRFIDNCYSGEDIEFISRYLMCSNNANSLCIPIYNFYFDTNRSINRNKNSCVLDIKDSVYWHLLNELKIINWDRGYAALALGKLPILSMLEILRYSLGFNSYREFRNGMSLFSKLIETAGMLDRHQVTRKTFLKFKLLYFLYIRFPFVFYRILKHRGKNG